MLKGLEQLQGREERMEEEHVQWHSWIQEYTSVQGSPSLRSLLRLSLGQLLCWTNSWTSALGRAFLGIFSALSLTSGFYCPFKQRLKTPQIPVLFSFFLYVILTVAQLNAFHKLRVQDFPSISSLEEAGLGRFSKV